MADVRYYPDDYTDEVVPCDCTLEGWAIWFSEPDPDWNRPAAARPGDTFLATVAHITELECVGGPAGAWQWDAAAEAELQKAEACFFLRHDSGGGWFADNSGETIAAALAYADRPSAGERAYIAAMVWGPRVELTYHDDGAPSLSVQQAGHA